MPSCVVGSFAMNTATGNQPVTGLPGPPKAIFFFGNFRTADGIVAHTADTSGGLNTLGAYLGMAASASAQAMVGHTDDFNSFLCLNSNAKCIRMGSGVGYLTNEADFVTMDATGFTIHWSTVDGVARIVNYFAVYGSDLTDVALVQVAAKTSTGNQATTGVGFPPDAMMVIGEQHTTTPVSANTPELSITQGFATGATERGYNTVVYTSGASRRFQKTDKVYGVASPSGGVLVEADLVTFDPDGFTFNYTTANGTAYLFWALCFKGGNYKTGSFTKRTSIGSNPQTGVGFPPSGLMLSSLNTNVAGVTLNEIQRFMGAASGATARGSIYHSDWNNGWKGLDRTKILKMGADDATPTVTYAADLTSLDLDGFTLNESVADANAREILYMAFGTTTTPTGGGSATPRDPSCGRLSIQQRMG
jgi:hypothetical protein